MFRGSEHSAYVTLLPAFLAFEYNVPGTLPGSIQIASEHSIRRRSVNCPSLSLTDSHPNRQRTIHIYIHAAADFSF
jgi:hypothetical protein